MSVSTRKLIAQQIRDERIREAAPEMLIAGKHLFVKLCALYEAAGANPSECSALRRWAEIVATAEGRFHA